MLNLYSSFNTVMANAPARYKPAMTNSSTNGTDTEKSLGCALASAAIHRYELNKPPMPIKTLGQRRNFKESPLRASTTSISAVQNAVIAANDSALAVGLLSVGELSIGITNAITAIVDGSQ